MPKPIEIPTNNGRKIHASYHLCDNGELEDREKLIIMVHGFPGNSQSHKNIFGDIETALAKSGHNTLRFDFRGCGQSDGQQQDFDLSTVTDDIEDILIWAEMNRHYNYVFIGEGLGAAFTAINAPRKHTKAYILLWPVLDPISQTQKILSLNQLTSKIERQGYIEFGTQKIGLNFLRQLGKLNIPKYLKSMKVPTLICHGSSDKAVPIEQMDIARTHIESRRLEITTFHAGKTGLEDDGQRQSLFFLINDFIKNNT